MTDILEIKDSIDFPDRQFDASDVITVFGESGPGIVRLLGLTSMTLFDWMSRERRVHLAVYPQHCGRRVLNHPDIYMSGTNDSCPAEFDRYLGISAISNEFQIGNCSYDYFWREAGHQYAAMAIVYLSDAANPGSWTMGLSPGGSDGSLGLAFDGSTLTGLISAGAGFSVTAQPSWQQGLNFVALQYQHDGTDGVLSLFINGAIVVTVTVTEPHVFSETAGSLLFTGSTGALLCFGCQYMGELTVAVQQSIFNLFAQSHTIQPAGSPCGYSAGGGGVGGGVGGGGGEGDSDFIVNDAGYLIPGGLLTEGGYMREG